MSSHSCSQNPAFSLKEKWNVEENFSDPVREHAARHRRHRTKRGARAATRSSSDGPWRSSRWRTASRTWRRWSSSRWSSARAHLRWASRWTRWSSSRWRRCSASVRLVSVARLTSMVSIMPCRVTFMVWKVVLQPSARPPETTSATATRTLATVMAAGDMATGDVMASMATAAILRPRRWLLLRLRLQAPCLQARSGLFLQLAGTNNRRTPRCRMHRGGFRTEHCQFVPRAIDALIANSGSTSGETSRPPRVASASRPRWTKAGR